jgi:hypothetical protein
LTENLQIDYQIHRGIKMKCIKCGSWAINHWLYGRDGSDGDLCDVCYWRKRADELQAKNDELDKKLLRALDAWAKVAELEDKYKPIRQAWGGSKVSGPIIDKAQGVV